MAGDNLSQIKEAFPDLELPEHIQELATNLDFVQRLQNFRQDPGLGGKLIDEFRKHGRSQLLEIINLVQNQGAGGDPALINTILGLAQTLKFLGTFDKLALKEKTYQETLDENLKAIIPGGESAGSGTG